MSKIVRYKSTAEIRFDKPSYLVAISTNELVVIAFIYHEWDPAAASR